MSKKFNIQVLGYVISRAEKSCYRCDKRDFGNDKKQEDVPYKLFGINYAVGK
jgi:hypothetical protein